MIVVHDGPAESVSWVASRLHEAAAVAAANPDARIEGRRECRHATADRERIGRRRQHHGSFSMETSLVSGWSGDRTVRIELVRGSSARTRIEIPLPPGPLSTAMADPASAIAGLAASLKRATVLTRPPAALDEALWDVARHAALVESGPTLRLRIAARTPWHPPEMTVHDRHAGCSRLAPTQDGLRLLEAAVPLPALRMEDGSDGTYALVPLRVEAPLEPMSALDAMRTIARGGATLCAPGRRRRRTW